MTLNELIIELNNSLQEAKTVQSLDEKRNIIARNFLSSLEEKLRNSLPENKKEIGLEITQYKDEIQKVYDEHLSRVLKLISENEINNYKYNLFLPGNNLPRGNSHILNQVAEEILDFLSNIGFNIVDGDEIVEEKYNFTNLNIPSDHPARSSNDSFFIKSNKEKMLKTHATATSALKLEEYANLDDIRIASFGNVFRKDTEDATHSHQFMQIDLFWVSEDISFANLKWLIKSLCQHLFGDSTKIRLRPSYFPFTEPSFEVDIARKYINIETGKEEYGDWIEVLGCGILHENVIKAAGIDYKKKVGLAAGIGIERIAMLKYGIEDIREFYDNQKEFLDQFVRG